VIFVKKKSIGKRQKKLQFKTSTHFKKRRLLIMELFMSQILVKTREKKAQF